MIFSLFLFYISLVLLFGLFALKWLEGKRGSIGVLKYLNNLFEPIFAPFFGKLAHFSENHLTITRIKAIAAFTAEIVSVIGQNLKADVRIMYRILTHQVKGNNPNRRKMTASFFLKDIADYKSRLLQEKHQ